MAATHLKSAPEALSTQQGITTKVVTLTPETAAKWFEARGKNRNYRETHAEYFARLIQSGEWRLTHQGVAFSRTGRMLDGQHRVSGIAKAGIACPIMVTWGLEEDAFDAIDSMAMARTISDLTGIPKRHAEYARYALSMVSMETKKHSPAEVTTAYLSLQPYIHEIEDTVRVRVKILTSMPVAYAAMLRFACCAATHRDYIKQVYHDVAHRQFENLPPVALAFMRKVMAGDIHVAGGRRVVPLLNAWVMFNPEKRDIGKIQITDETERKLLAEIKQLTRLVLEMES